jgi:hypothetical protein
MAGKQRVPVEVAEFVWEMLGQGAGWDAVAEALRERGSSPAAAARIAQRFDDRYQDRLRLGMRWPALSEAEDLIERSARLAAPVPVDSRRAWWVGVGVSALFLAGGAYFQEGGSDDIGKACKASTDCPRNAMCMMVVDESRRITGGYCTIACDDNSDCNGETHCAEAYETTSDQGPSWDGMLGKRGSACVKYH